MDKRKFLQMLGCLPFIGVATTKSLANERYIVREKLREMLDAKVFENLPGNPLLLEGKILHEDTNLKEIWYIGKNKRAFYRWIGTPGHEGVEMIIEDEDG